MRSLFPDLENILYIKSLVRASVCLTGQFCHRKCRTGLCIFYGRTGQCTDGNLPDTLPVFTVIANTSTIRLLVLITLFLNLLFLRTDLRLSVCRGPETQCPFIEVLRAPQTHHYGWMASKMGKPGWCVFMGGKAPGSH